MPEIPSLNSYINHAPTHRERASLFISEEMTQRDREAAIDMATAFEDKDRPAAKTAVLIPVAAHQDNHYIFPTLGEYAKQKTTSPFTVFLSLNAPLDAIDAISKTAEAEAIVYQAREAFPRLDVRSSTTLYDEPTIGLIRRDLWNAAFLLAHYEHGFSDDVTGVNNDIDTHSISPHYISRIQQHYEQRTARYQNLFGDSLANTAVHSSVATRVTHARLSSHPNTAKVTTWVDNTCFQAPGRIGYEAGLVIPFSRYAHNGGFDANAITHETARLYTNYYRPYLSGAQLYTSPRRYIDRLHEHDTSEIWTTDSFGSDDTCRNTLPPDISRERAEDIILGSLDSDIRERWLPGAIDPILTAARLRGAIGNINHDETLAKATNAAEKQLSKSERLMRKMIGSPLLASLINESFDAKSYAEKRVASFEHALRASRGQ